MDVVFAARRNEVDSPGYDPEPSSVVMSSLPGLLVCRVLGFGDVSAVAGAEDAARFLGRVLTARAFFSQNCLGGRLLQLQDLAEWAARNDRDVTWVTVARAA